jgi:hypothetical protein
MGFRGFDRTVGVNACCGVVSGCAGMRAEVRSSKHVQVGKEPAGATSSSRMDAISQTSAFVNVFYVLC